MRIVRHLIVLPAFLFICLLGASQTRTADHFGTPQFFGDWHNHARGFSFRPYYYKPHNNFVGFKHHYVVHFQSHPLFNYFYNPYTRQFWGRCPVATEGEASYSLLAENDRNGDINKIPESAFPKAGAMPPVPESTDGATMDLPPDDLPTANELPASDAK